MEKQALIIFAKNPVIGNVKTRLAKVIGDEKALSYYSIFLAIVHSYTKDLPCQKIVYWDGGIPSFHPFFDDDFFHEQQPDGDIGFKMSMAFKKELGRFDSVCIIGTDCLELTKEILLSAFEKLDNHDLVIGPAKDGGYYLLGMNQFEADLFKGIKWSTDSVLRQTLERIISLKLSYKKLIELNDVDTYEDLIEMKERGIIL